MNEVLKYKMVWLVRVLFILANFFVFQSSIVAASVCSINYEYACRSYSSIDLKIAEKTNLPTSQNLKDAVNVLWFTCKTESDWLDYRNSATIAAGNAVKTGASLTKSQLKSISSLESQIAKHQIKLVEYIKNPMKFDNRGFLKNAPNDVIRQKIIQSRINHLKQEIQAFQNSIQKILNGQ